MIRQMRLDLKMSQRELSEGLGCRQQTVSEWETGMYDPKNAYQKLLDQFFSSERVKDEEE